MIEREKDLVNETKDGGTRIVEAALGGTGRKEEDGRIQPYRQRRQRRQRWTTMDELIRS